jgi:L-lactate dehydrogenase (cytochrome)
MDGRSYPACSMGAEAVTAIDSISNISGLRKKASRRLPRPIFDYLDGGADDEKALHRSSSAFGDIEIIPSMLTGATAAKAGHTLFGKPIDWPLMLAPTGLTRLFHADAELAVARAASREKIPYCLSTLGTTSLETFASVTRSPRLFQIYIFKDRGLTAEFVARAKAADYDGLLLTVDTVVAGNRERDRVNGLSLPPRLTPRSLLSFARHPRWSIRALAGEPFEFVNVSHRAGQLGGTSTSLFEYIARQFDPALRWSDLDWLAAQWGKPLAVKGVMSVDDAERSHANGASAVMISNHGGRQLDEAPAPIDQIGRIADRMSGRMEIICDGGIRRGSDIVKARALGADACSIGRAYLYGLAAGGEAGVTRALTLLREEYERTLILAGAPESGRVDRHSIRFRRSPG